MDPYLGWREGRAPLFQSLPPLIGGIPCGADEPHLTLSPIRSPFKPHVTEKLCPCTENPPVRHVLSCLSPPPPPTNGFLVPRHKREGVYSSTGRGQFRGLKGCLGLSGCTVQFRCLGLGSRFRRPHVLAWGLKVGGLAGCQGRMSGFKA